MKRYILFAHDFYDAKMGRYPAGGASDIQATFATYEEAVAYMNADLLDPDEPHRGKRFDTYEILDTASGHVTTF